MTAQLWALVTPDGSYALRFTDSVGHHPADYGHADECEGAEVWPLDREPRAALGEGVDPATGAFDFDLARVADSLIAAIKAEAGRRIESVAPLWRQINDLTDPTAPGAADRAASIASIRNWSNEAETMVLTSLTADDLAETLTAIAAGWPA
jgi:hypothetical protein